MAGVAATLFCHTTTHQPISADPITVLLDE